MTTIYGEVTCHDQLVDALRARKEHLGLSNAFVDDLIMLAGGHTDKLLGPARKRGLSPFTLDAMLTALALKLVVVQDDEQADRMRARWGARDARQVRSPVRTATVGPAVIRRARFAVARELGRAGGRARWKGTTPELRRKLMRAVWETRTKPLQSDARAAAETLPNGAP
jgi:hypothetical protein